MTAPPSEDLLSYVDVSVNTSKVTKSLGIGASICKLEIIKYNGSAVSPSTYISNLKNNIALSASSASGITATCNTSYSVDGDYNMVYYPYTVRIYYYPDSYVGCTVYSFNSSGTTATLPNNTFMMYISLSGTSAGQHAWVYPIGGSVIRDTYSGSMLYIANTSEGIYAQAGSNYSVTLYAYYYK